MNWLLWLGLVAATVSITRLLVKDEFPPIVVIRDWFMRTFGLFEAGTGELVAGSRWGKLGYTLAYLWTCPWCMSVWVALGLWGAAVWLGFSVPLPWLMVAAARLAAGWLASIEERIDQRYELAKLEIAKRTRDERRETGS